MSVNEFRRWMQYHHDYPFSDFHRYHKPAALIAHSMAGADMETLLNYLQPPTDEEKRKRADLSVIKALGIKRE